MFRFFSPSVYWNGNIYNEKLQCERRSLYLTIAKAMAKANFIMCGTFLHSTDEKPLEVLQDYCIGVKNGKIEFVDDVTKLPQRLSENGHKPSDVIYLPKCQFVIPGFIDTHIHAPQYPNAGKGLDVGLLEWLERYTFPTESRFTDKKYAVDVYRKVVDRTVKNGTTTACYYATNHTDASLLLCDIIASAGQRALVGKVNADQNCPDYYVESGVFESVSETRRFVEEVFKRKYERITPVVTPRFAVSCSEDLLKELGNIAHEYDIPVQTHICETIQEISCVSGLYPHHSNYTEVYDKAGLLTHKTVLGHGIYLTPEEIRVIKERESSISHCPNSNLSIRSGLLDLRNILSQGVKVGLGTDVSGGYHPSIMDAMRTALQVSNVHAIQKRDYHAISHTEAFRLATLGGARALSLGDVVGNFEVGKQFDALIIDPTSSDSPVDLFQEDSLLDSFQKFIYNGDDRNIVVVYVDGHKVHERWNL